MKNDSPGPFLGEDLPSVTEAVVTGLFVASVTDAVVTGLFVASATDAVVTVLFVAEAWQKQSLPGYF